MAQLKDLTVTGNSVFNGTVTLDADPTSAMQAATKQYVDNQGGGGGGDCVVISISHYTVTFDSGSTTTGTISQGIYTAISTAYSDDKIPIIVDDNGDLDAIDGAIKTYYFSDSASGFSFISPPDNDSHTNVLWRLIIGSQDEFEIQTISLGGGTPASSVTAVGASAVVGTSTNYARQDHVHNIALATGTNNGQVKIAGTDVSVKGLGVNAYTNYTSGIARPTYTKSGTFDPTLQSLISSRRPNRLAFLPADQIIVEKTTDGGTTWTDAGFTDAQKVQLFSEIRPNIIFPTDNGSVTSGCGIRITFTAIKYNVPSGTAETLKYPYWNSTYYSSTERYCTMRDMYFWLSTRNAGVGVSVKLEAAKGNASATWVSLFDSGSSWAMNGYSGSDYITFTNTTFGGASNQAGNYWNWRLTMLCRDASGGTDIASGIANGPILYEIRGYGDLFYTTYDNTNAYQSIDHLYRWDYQKNATFPAKLTVGSAPTADMDVATKKYVDDNAGGGGSNEYVIEVPITLYDGNSPVNGDSTVFDAAKTAMQAGKKVYIKIKAEQVEGTGGASYNWVYHLLSGYHSTTNLESMVFMWNDFFGGEPKNIRVIFSKASSIIATWVLSVDTYATASGVSF